LGIFLKLQKNVCLFLLIGMSTLEKKIKSCYNNKKSLVGQDKSGLAAFMRIGKLKNKELKDSVIDIIGSKRPEVLSSAGISKDCAAVKCEDIILLTSDPITASSHIVGRLAILVSSNDIAAGGGEPFCCLITIIAPTGSTAEDIKSVMAEAENQAASLNIDIVGGHTEFSPYVSQTLVSCTMLGRTKKTIGKKLSGGETIIMTKYAAIEGTIIAVNHEKAERILDLSPQEREFADGLVDNLSVLDESRIAVLHDISVMHDITEGGVYGAVYEVCLSNGVGAEIFESAVPVLSVTQKVCEAFGYDPCRLISSGSMLIITEKPDELIKALDKAGINAVKIGVINNTEYVKAIKKDGQYEIIESEEDEISRLVYEIGEKK
jgi:hydrogenase expression/formation protein HypE